MKNLPCRTQRHLIERLVRFFAPPDVPPPRFSQGEQAAHKIFGPGRVVDVEPDDFILFEYEDASGRKNTGRFKVTAANFQPSNT